MILKYLMRMLEERRGYYVEPWQEFDMIGGTSTGGYDTCSDLEEMLYQSIYFTRSRALASWADNLSLLAIMLGRLRMSLDECETAYLSLSQEIFTPTRSATNIPGKVYDFLQANGKFDSEPLERSIKSILRAQDKSEDELLKDDDPDACKV